MDRAAIRVTDKAWSEALEEAQQLQEDFTRRRTCRDSDYDGEETEAGEGLYTNIQEDVVR